jgi:hypothetical protein
LSSVDMYTRAGVVLMVFGAPFAAFSYWILGDVTFTSVGLASLIIGATALLVPSRAVPGESVRALVEAAAVNVEALLEEFDAGQRGYYLPPRDGRVYCFVPLAAGFDERNLQRFDNVPLRVVSSVLGASGVSVFPPGSEVVRLAGLGEESGVEDALVFVLVDYVELVESVRAVVSGDRVVVELVKPRVDTEYARFRQCLGSVPSSVAGCVLAWVLGEPVAFLGEEQVGDKVTASFRIIYGPNN